MPDPPRGPAEEGILYRKAGAPARRRPVPSVEGGLLQAASGAVTASDAALDRQVIDAVNEAALSSVHPCMSYQHCENFSQRSAEHTLLPISNLRAEKLGVQVPRVPSETL